MNRKITAYITVIKSVSRVSILLLEIFEERKFNQERKILIIRMAAPNILNWKIFKFSCFWEEAVNIKTVITAQKAVNPIEACFVVIFECQLY